MQHKDSSAFWKLMVQNVSGRSLRDLDFITDPDRQYQVFEVLVVDVLRRCSSDIVWAVTPVSGDAGIDFTGERETLRLSIFGNVELDWKIVGQIKRMRTPDEAKFMKALASVREVARRETVSGVMLVVSSDVKPDRIRRLLEKDVIRHEYAGPKWFVPADHFLACFAADPERLKRITANCYDSSEHVIIQSFLAQRAGHFDPDISAVVSHPTIAQAGRFIRCELLLRSLSPLPQLRFRLRHRPDPEEQRIVEVARPSRLASTEGIAAFLNGPERRKQTVWLRSFAPGNCRLGSIEILDFDGRLCASVPLGEIEIKPFFSPPYFAEPNRGCERKIIPKLEAAMAGSVEAIVMTGAGGSGKSRFCERVVDLAVDQGFTWVAIRQENAYTNGRRLIEQLMASIVVRPSDGPVTKDDILCSVGRLLARKHPAIVETARTYLSQDSGPIDQEHIAIALLTLLVENVRDSPLVVHLHDLHWAGAEVFTIIGLLLDYLRRNEHSLRHGILWVFEGRSRESLLDVETQTFRVPEEWFAFLKSTGLDQVRIPSWSREQCRDYLSGILEIPGIRNRPIEASALPLYEELVTHIQDRAQGNPMHLLEQLKRLYELEIVLQRDNGLLYVHKGLPRRFETPSRVEDLIRARIDHYRRINAKAVELMVVLARIGRRVPGSIFAALTRGARLTTELRLLEQMDVAVIPRDGAAFEFGHENYFQVFRSLAIAGRSGTLRSAIKIYDEMPAASLRHKAEFVRLLDAADGPLNPKILKLVVAGMRESRVAEEDFLLEEFIRRFLSFDSGSQDAAEIDPLDTKYELAEIMTRIGDWNDARQQLEEIVESAERQRGIRWVYHCARAKAELANVYVSLQDADAAIVASDAGLDLVNSVLSEADESRPGFLLLREKLWHRKAVAMWFDGRAVDAIRWQWKSYRSTRLRNEKYESATVLREIGTLLLHRNPRFGIRVLERALALGHSLSNFHHASLFIIEVQLTMGRLLASLRSAASAPIIKGLQGEAEQIYHRCMGQLTRYEASIAALVCGAAAGYLRELEEAHHWFRIAATISVQSSLKEEIWKARLNLAQIALEMGKTDEAVLHAEEAADIILEGLMAGRREHRKQRRSLMQLPIAHVVNIAGTQIIRSALRSGLVPDPYPTLLKWDERPHFCDRASQQVLHVRRDQYDYFLMN
jgi:tetratricopeptide (TPR) repeat protein